MTSAPRKPADSRPGGAPRPREERAARPAWLRAPGTPTARWTAFGTLLFMAAATALFHPLIGAEGGAPTLAATQNTGELRNFWSTQSLNDLRFVVAVLARNGRVLLESPGRLFDLEHCYPTENALALGEPIIASSILGMPAALLFSEPSSVYNFVLVVSTLLAAGGMAWLVGAWTGSPPAACVAGLLYAFHTIRMRDPVHFYVWDNVWTLLALLFARRLFVAPRVRDAAGLSACIGMQVAGSVYPLLVALLVALPMTAWFARTYGLSRVRWGLVAVVIAFGALASWLALGPFFDLQEQGSFRERADQYFLAFRWLAPGDRFFPGVVLIVLAIAGIVLPGGADREKLGGDPRFALTLALLVCLAFATGGMEGEIREALLYEQTPPRAWLPNPWSPLATVLPVLGVIRSPGALLSGVHAMACVLAGFGAAALLRRCPPRFTGVAIAVLIAAAWVDTLRPAWLGLPRKQDYGTVDLRPAPEILRFYEQLEAMGNAGPIYEIAFFKMIGPRRTEPLINASYHQRPVSFCYNSFVRRPGEAAEQRLPDPAGLAELRALGFTTLVIHDPYLNARGRRLDRDLRALAEADPEHTLRKLLEIDAMTAYAITAEAALPREDDAAPEPSQGAADEAAGVEAS